MSKKILYAATVAKKHICQFHIPYMKMLQEWGYEVHVCAADDFNEDEKCEISHCDKFYDICFSRNPFSPKNITAYRKVRRIIKENNYELIHCHTPVAAAVTRLAAVGLNKETVVLYTTHGFHFFKGAPMSSIMYYLAEKLLVWFTDGIITINAEDFGSAQKICQGTSCEAYYMHGTGVDTQKIKNSSADPKLLKRKLGIPEDSFVLLSVSEINKNKNLKTSLTAMSMINDDSVYYVICGEGDMLDEYRLLAVNLGIDSRVIFTGYRYDIFEVVHIADLFLFPSLREGLGIAPLEAMSAGVPIIASDIRGVREYGRNNVNGILLRPDDSKGFADAVIKLKNNEDLRTEMSRNAVKSVIPFDINESLSSMAAIYSKYIEKEEKITEGIV